MSATLTVVARHLKLLEVVLLFFRDHVKSITDNSPRGSNAWINHMSLYVTLNEMIVPAKELMNRFRERTWSTAETECGALTRRVLQLFENWSTVGNGTPLEPTPLAEVLEYPTLLRIEAGTFPKLGRQSDQWIETTLIAFDQLAQSYGQLCSRVAYPAQVGSDAGKPPSWNIREHLQILHDTLKKFWTCQCQSPHEGMLFLATHRKPHDRGGTEFDLLFGSTTLPAWNEAQVFVATPLCQHTRTGFEPFRLPQRKQNIEHVCEAIHDLPPDSRLKLIVNGSSLWQTQTRDSILKVKNAIPSATFLDVLSGPTLNLACKIKFAVILAYNFLYLCGSSWLPCPWDKRAIKFLRSDQSLVFEEILRPLLAANYSASSVPDTLPAGRFHKDQARLALGILLIEIFEQQAIEGMRDEAKDCTSKGPLTTDINLFTADRVYENIPWDVHEGYKRAVLACLDKADVDEKPWDDVEHFQFIYTRVIKPLEQELEIYCGISIDDLDDTIRAHAEAAERPITRNSSEPPVASNASLAHSADDLYSTRIETTRSMDSPKGFLDIVNSPRQASLVGAPDQQTYWTHETHVTTRPSLDSKCDAESTLETCRATDVTNDILPHAMNPLSLYHVQSSNQDRNKETQDWFTHFRETVLKVTRRDTTKEERIKIAVLDTGVRPETFTRWSLERNTKNRVSYMSFVSGDEDCPPRDDADHGTHTAALLLSTAPNADVLIARVADGTSIDAADSITKAIKHFTTVQKVDIISMSFGFPLLEPSLDGLNKALLEAHRADIVLFAAGHNSGGRKRVSFPANQDHVICIGACDGLNWSSSFNPSRIHNMFCTLGENIVTPWQTAGSLSKSGTSYATPIAAGIAAVVMDWMIHESRSWSQEDQRHSRKVRTKSGIVKIFQEKLSEERNGYRVLVPWALFNEDSIGYAKGVLLDILINM